MNTEISTLTLLMLLALLLIVAALFWLSKKYTRKAPQSTLMNRIQKDIIQQLARESDVRKTGQWRESAEKELVLLNPASVQVMSEQRVKKFDPRRHSFPAGLPELVPITDYYHQDLVWALVYGHKKKGRRYDLHPYHGGRAAAILEIYDYDPGSGFCALFSNGLYYVRHGIITSADSQKTLCQTLDVAHGTSIRTTGGETFHYQRGDGIHLTEEPETLRPDSIANASGASIIELHYNYIIRILSQPDEETLSALIMMLFHLHRNIFE